MQNKPINLLIDALQEVNWNVTLKDSSKNELNEAFNLRYPKLPEDYSNFLCYVKSCSNTDDTAWFLCEDDYNGNANSAFAWNEFEVQSLEAAEDNSDLTKTIIKFWDQHLPFMLSVKSGYAFLGLRLSEEGFGEIVSGREPEYEDVRKVCDSFAELTQMIIAVVQGEQSFPSLITLF